MRRAAIVIGIVVYAFILIRYGCYAAGGADSSGYLNFAKLLARGEVLARVTPLDTLGLDSSWDDVFHPLGFVDAPVKRMMAPSYPVGYPLHLAPLGALFKWKRAPFLVTPIAALLCLFVTYKLARALSLSDGMSLGAAVILALSPPFLFMAIQPMSDIVATLWCTLAILLAVKERPALAGLAFAIAVTVRPTNILLAIPLAIALRWNVRRLAIAVAAAMPVAIALMLLNRTLYGSPLMTGYGSLRDMMSWSFALARFPHYTKWMLLLETPLIFPGGLLVAFDRNVERWQRALLAVWFALFFGFYCFYWAYDAWWYTRFLLPAFPALIIGALLFMRRAEPAIAAALIALIAITGIYFTHKFATLRLRDQETTYVHAAAWSAKRLPKNAIVASMQMSGAMYFHDGRFSARYDILTPDRFALLRAYAANAHQQWYAVVFDWEEEALRRNMPGTWTKVGEMENVRLLRLD